ncbi:MAG: V-type ATP synthase subunit F [Candidatus Bilamarchaeaceae archaeon]
MKAKILVIGDMPLVTGMRLAGLENCWAASESDFQQKLESALGKEEFGIIVVNEYLLNKIDWRLRKKLDSIAYPVIVPMPAYTGVSEERDEIRNMIKRALGFDLSKR